MSALEPPMTSAEVRRFKRDILRYRQERDLLAAAIRPGGVSDTWPVETLAALATAHSTDRERMEWAILAFLEVWPEAEKAINGLCMFTQTHGMRYTGPSLQPAIDGLRKAVGR
jgi:hypothetical protein